MGCGVGWWTEEEEVSLKMVRVGRGMERDEFM